MLFILKPSTDLVLTHLKKTVSLSGSVDAWSRLEIMKIRTSTSSLKPLKLPTLQSLRRVLISCKF